MPKVYVVHQKHHDLSNAEKFGELVYITQGDVPIFQTNNVIDTVKDKLSPVQLNDFLLLSGAPVLNCVAFNYIMSKYGVVNILIFNAKIREYIPRVITEQQIVQGV